MKTIKFLQESFETKERFQQERPQFRKTRSRR